MIPTRARAGSLSESEMRGIPVRVEIGPRDIENNEAVLVRRDTHEKITAIPRRDRSQDKRAA